MDYELEENAGDDEEYDEQSERLDELERRIEELKSGSGSEAGLTAGYAMGMSLAMILSWSRNASILWCLLHGILSWAYVIYFAITR
jgi:tetrahydromethanopterin S-methyltransferase subunit G